MFDFSLKNIIRKLFQISCQQMDPNFSFEIEFWDKQKEKFGSGKPQFTLIFKSKSAVKNIFKKGSSGFCEEYVKQNIEIEGDMEQFFRFGNVVKIDSTRLPFYTKVAIFMQHIASLNTLNKAKENIAHHYDLGNDFFKLWLDESMTYSCAYFRNSNDSLEKAQQQKYEHICRKLMLKKDDTLIDIGCGWGGMLFYAAEKYGIKGTGCTISKEQFDYCVQKTKEKHLENSIQFLFEDYRNIKGEYDKFVSIGMFEHVGKKYIPAFIEKVRKILKPGAIGLLHTIGKEKASSGSSWTEKYIFPGYYLPCLDEIIFCMGKKELVPTDIENLRLHYSKTLDCWAQRFSIHRETISKMFDPSFVRMWELFLKGSSLDCCKYGNLRLYQILFSKGINNTLPMTRDYVYEKPY